MKKSSSRNSFCYSIFVKNTLEWKFLPDMEKWRVFVGNKLHKFIDLELWKSESTNPNPNHNGSKSILVIPNPDVAQLTSRCGSD